MTTFRLDHIVVAAADLEDGRRWGEVLLGVPSPGGGRHAAMGTHNVLWGVGEVYLEVIAIDPAAPPPDRPRWFGLDDPDLRAALSAGPALVSWAVATEAPQALAALAAPVPLGPVEPFARDDLTWEVRIPEGRALPLGGAWPLVIRWTSGLHPARRLPDQGLRLERFELRGAGVADVAAALGPVAGPVVLAPDSGPVRLRAELRTPRGPVVLAGPPA